MEYKIIIIEDKIRKENLEKELNDLGELGWELVSMDINPIRCLIILIKKGK